MVNSHCVKEIKALTLNNMKIRAFAVNPFKQEQLSLRIF